MKAAIYAGVSTFDQKPENQLQELRRYVQARGWTAQEYVDRGISGTKDRRPAVEMNWYATPSAGGSMCWSAGGWIDLGGTCDT